MKKTNEQHELYHFGVLGMKWGIRNSREVRGVIKNKKTYRDKDTYNKAKNKAKDEASDRLYSKIDRPTRLRINKLSFGKALAQNTLMGDFGALSYNKFRSAGVSKRLSAIKGFVVGNIDRQLVGIPSSAIYIQNLKARKKAKN